MMPALTGQTVSHVPTQVLTGGAVYGLHGAVQAETTTLLAAMTVQPDLSRRYLIDDMILSLKNTGLWTPIDFLFVPAAHDEQAGRVNWKNPATVGTNNGATFTANRGYTGNGTSAWIDTGLNWSTLGHFLRDDCSVGLWAVTTDLLNQAIGGVTASRVLITVGSTPAIGSKLNSSAAALTNNIVSCKGYSAITRSVGTDYNVYKDGAFLANNVAASAAIVSDTVALLRNVTAYSINSSFLGAVHGGGGLTAAQIANLYSIVSTYMVGVGAA